MNDPFCYEVDEEEVTIYFDESESIAAGTCIIVMEIPYKREQTIDGAFYTKSEAISYAAGFCDRMNSLHKDGLLTKVNRT